MIDGMVSTEDFSLVGVSHWNTPVEVREKFSLSTAQTKKLIHDAKRRDIENIIVVSTCNRTEIFAQKTTHQELIRLLTIYSAATRDNFNRYGFKKQGEESLNHFFRMATGLDSQILGDLQIIKQVKQAYKLAANLGTVSGEMHQLMQHVFRAHKRSRSETSLGEGAATTAYAAVKFAKETFNRLDDKRILLVGTGKIGQVACKNLISMGADKLTLINRTHKRAEFVADKYDLKAAGMNKLPEEIAKADLILVATGADQPIVGMDEMKPSVSKPDFKMMVDLAVPRNIDPNIERLDFVELVNMDLLTSVTDEAQQQRKENIPKVEKIIEDEQTDYQLWLNKQAVVPTIKALTSKFDTIRKDEYDFFKNKIAHTDRDKVDNLTRRIVNKIAAYSIEHLRRNHNSEQITQVVNDMFKLETSTSNE